MRRSSLVLVVVVFGCGPQVDGGDPAGSDGGTAVTPTPSATSSGQGSPPGPSGMSMSGAGSTSVATSSGSTEGSSGSGSTGPACGATHKGSIVVDDGGGIEAISGVAVVTGWVEFFETDVVDFAGAECLSEVQQGLTVGSNDSLESLAGLEQLTIVGGTVSIFDHPNLTDVTALGNLQSVEVVSVTGNAQLCASQVDEVFADVPILENMGNAPC